MNFWCSSSSSLERRVSSFLYKINTHKKKTTTQREKRRKKKEEETKEEEDRRRKEEEDDRREIAQHRDGSYFIFTIHIYIDNYIISTIFKIFAINSFFCI